MIRFLPPHPNLERLKNEAKSILKAHKAGREAVCETFCHLKRFQGATNAEILAASVNLSEAQFALAQDYGFRDWNALSKAVAAVRPIADYSSHAEPGAILLSNTLPGNNEPNRLCSALSMVLRHLGSDTDYIQIVGDSGQAFILQADSVHGPYGREGRPLDLGWWPLDAFGVDARLGFLGRVHGIELQHISLLDEFDVFSKHPALHYREKLHDLALENLRAGRPIVALCPDVWVVYGCDQGNPPLLGQPACEESLNIRRMDNYPYALIAATECGEPLPRARADHAAIDFAVKLARDEADVSAYPGKLTGGKAWRLWFSQLLDTDDMAGPPFFSGDILRSLRINRRCAAPYLARMASRHPEAGKTLIAASHCYREVIDALEGVTIRTNAWKQEDRERLVETLQGILAMETRAVELLANVTI